MASKQKINTKTITLLKVIYKNGDPISVGTKLTLPTADADELIGLSKAVESKVSLVPVA